MGIQSMKVFSPLPSPVSKKPTFTITESDVDVTIEFDNVTLIGQFHDELVMDWTPPKETDQNAIQDVNDAVDLMAQCMTDPVLQESVLHGFPLDAEVHYDYRYIK